MVTSNELLSQMPDDLESLESLNELLSEWPKKISPSLRIRLPAKFTVCEDGIARPQEVPSLPAPRRWLQSPQKLGDTGLSDLGEKWIWLQEGLKWLDSNADSCHPLTLDQCAHIAGGLADLWAGHRPLSSKPEPLREPSSISPSIYACMLKVW